MLSPDHHRSVLLSIYPFHRGMGFAVFDSVQGLVDWGIARLDPDNESEVVERLDGIREWNKPDRLVIENAGRTQRGPRARGCTQTALHWALHNRIPVTPVPRKSIHSELGATQQDIAVTLSRLLPELSQYLPTKRREWESVDERMFLFMAVALVVVGFGDLVEAA